MKFHVIHDESDAHFETDAISMAEAYDQYPEGYVSIWLPEECPACKRGWGLEK